MKDLYDVLFVDFMVEDTHKYYCNALIKAINNYCSSVAVEKYGYLEYKSTERNKIIYVKTKETVNNYPIKARIAAFYNYLNTICAVKNYRFKKIIVLGKR